MTRHFIPSYKTYGREDDPLVILAMGAGEQLVHWPRSLIDGLVSAGFQVLAFDARDVGHSPRFDANWPADPRPILEALAQGQDVPLPYTLDDMAGDIIGLLDQTGAEKAHLVGISLGAMQAQLAASSHPERVSSLTSIMSNSGSPDLPPPDVAVTTGLIASVDPAMDMSERIERFIAMRKPMSGSAFHRDAEEWTDLARRSLEREAAPSGTVRQIAASMACRDRHTRLASVQSPTLVIHGSDDPVMSMASAEDTAARIAGAQLHVIEGMGHDLSEALGATLAPVLTDHFKNASQIKEDEQSK